MTALVSPTQRSGHSTQETISHGTREEQILIQQRVQGIIGLLLKKLNRIYPNNGIAFLDSKTSMFSGVHGECFTFRVGANFRFVFPIQFIIATDKIDNETLDFLVQNWVFQINGKDIPMREWFQTDIIDSLIHTSSSGVVAIVQSGITIQESKRIELIRGKLKRLTDTLLPSTRMGNDDKASLLPQLGKNPIITVKPRG